MLKLPFLRALVKLQQRCIFHRSFILGCLLTACPVFAADKTAEWLKLLPEGVVASVTIKDMPELLKDWKSSGFARFLDDEAVKKWMAPLYEDGLPKWEREFKKEVGKDFSEMASVITGSFVAGFVVDLKAEIKEDKGGGVALIDITGKEVDLPALKQQQLENIKKQAPKAVMKEFEVDGHKAGKIMSDDSDEAKPHSIWAVVEGTYVEASSEELLEQTVANLKAGSGEGGRLVEHLQRVTEITGPGQDCTITLDLVAFVKAIETKLMKDAAKQDEAANPFNPAMFLGVFGLEDLRSMAVSVDLSEKGYSSDFIFTHTDGSKGLLPSLFRGTGKEAQQLPIIPAGTDIFGVSNYSLANVYDSLLAALQKLGPLAGMVTMQVASFEEKLGTSIRNDLLGSLDDTIIQAQLTPDTGDLVGSAVNAIKLKDKARFKASFDAIMKNVGQGFAMFEESEVHGVKVMSLKSSLTPDSPEANATKIAFAITDEYFIFSQGKPEMLNKFLARLKSQDGPSAWDEAEVQSVISALPKNPSSLSATRPAAIVKMIVGLITTVQEISSKEMKTDFAEELAKGEGEKKAKTDEDSDKWFDPKATPSTELMQRYFGAAASGYYVLSDAVHLKLISPPAETK
jgi:hypothetical protein